MTKHGPRHPIGPRNHRRHAGPPRLIALLLVMFATLKGAYLLSTFSLPFVDGPLFDSVVYLQQARAVRAGELGDATLVAFSPLYGYLLAALNGPNLPGLVIGFQFILGGVNAWLVFDATRGRFGARAGLAAAALYAGYGLLMFYESKLLSETLGITLSLLVFRLYLGDRFRAGHTIVAAFCGGGLGLAILARASLLFCAPFFVVIAAIPWSAGVSPASEPPAGRFRCLRRSIALAAGLTLVLGLNGLWNQRNTGLFVPVILVSETVAKTTHAEWSGTLETYGKRGRGASAWDVVDQARERIRAHARHEPRRDRSLAASVWGIDWAGWLLGAPRKLIATFGDVERGFQYGYYGERSEVPALQALPITFHTILLFGAIGSLLTIRRRGWRALLPFLPFMLGVLVTTTLFHPSSRYRLAMILPLIILGGHGFVACLRRAREPGRPAVRAMLIVLLATCGYFAWGTMTYELRHPATWHLTVAHAAMRRGDVTTAHARALAAIRLAPNNPKVRARIGIIFQHADPKP